MNEKLEVDVTWLANATAKKAWNGQNKDIEMLIGAFPDSAYLRCSDSLSQLDKGHK